MSARGCINVRRFVVAVSATTLSFGVLVVVPQATVAHGRGRLVTVTTKLTGPDARPVAPAGVHGGAVRITRGAASPGWSASVDVDDRTRMVDLSWRGAPTGTVEIRTKAGGRWSPWSAQAAERDEGPDRGGNGRNGVGPVWLGHDGGSDIELRVRSGLLDDLVLDAMRWEHPAAAGGSVAGAEPAGPAIEPRSSWAPGGWRADNPGCSPAPVVMDQLRFAVVHHTVDSNDYAPADVPAMLAATYRYHTEVRGWCDIAYNFLIDRFGRVWQGRSGDINDPIFGGHAKGFNTSSVGVALIGQFEPGATPTASQPSTEALGALRDLLAWKLGAHSVDPAATVQVESLGSTRYPEGTVVTIPTVAGHRDVGLTACPGANLYPLLSGIGREAAGVIASSATPARWAPFTTPQAMAAQDVSDLLRRPATNGEIGGAASRMVRDGTSHAALVTSALAGGPADDQVGATIRLYLADFLRWPDVAGLSYWTAQRAAGRSLLSVSNYFARSPEFQHRYGPLTDEEFVRRVYLNVLHREPDADGATYWLSRLQAGMSRGSVVLTFSVLNEFRSEHRSEVIVAMAFFDLVDQLPDDATRTDWAARVTAEGSPASLVESLLASPEYSSRFG